MKQDHQMITRIDHLVLTVQSIAATCEFYETALGMKVIEFGEGRKALIFGQQKINLHELGKEFEPKAKQPTAGSGDLCFVTTWPMSQLAEHFTRLNIQIEEGPVNRTGATGDIVSLYIRDPDGNLIEISSYRFLKD